ncbi:protein B4-like isoform 1-T1 [Salvelinus alpinus]
MPPKKKAAAAEEVTSSSDLPKNYENVSGKAKSESSNAPAVARRTPLHPPTMVMVNEALKELDSRKGVSSQAIRGYITEKYPSVDLVRLKYMIRKTLKKGFEGGVLVRTSTRKQTEHRGGFGCNQLTKTAATNYLHIIHGWQFPFKSGLAAIARVPMSYHSNFQACSQG